jgi:hypothetical protein
MNLPGFTAAASLSHAGAHRPISAHAVRLYEGGGSAVHSRSEYSVHLSAKGQDFPGTTCTCKGCTSGGGDLTGQCSSVCRDKTVYSKGSEPHDYCKAATRGSQPWWWNFGRVPSARFIGF